LKYLWNPYTLKRRCCRARPEYRQKRAITFDPTVGMRSKFYSSFRNSFLEVSKESLLVKEEVLSRQTKITTEKGHNF